MTVLESFVTAGILHDGDLRVAARLAEMAGEDAADQILAAALAVRAARLGRASVDLSSIHLTATPGEDGPDRSQVAIGPDAVPTPDDRPVEWPEPRKWVAALSSSALVGGDDTRPLHLEGSDLYLNRYWRDEQAVATDLLTRAARHAPRSGRPDAELLGSVFPEATDQRRAATIAAERLLTVICGGPGTGKTTTVAGVVACLHAATIADPALRPPIVALAAPTGKAAARLEEAVRAAASTLRVPDATRAWMGRLEAKTIDRLLGTRPYSATARHDHSHRLSADAVLVDEVSMVSLPLMRRLLHALRPDARVILVGDPDQLRSVEAGAVLADIVSAAEDGSAGPLAASVIRLTSNYRFQGALADMASAVRQGDADKVIDILGSGGPSLRWLAMSAEAASDSLAGPVGEWAGRLVAKAAAGETAAALAVLGGHRLLCAHRHGPAGAQRWNALVEEWAPTGLGTGWYPGRPVMVTVNDYTAKLYNGDVGVAVLAAASGPGPSPQTPHGTVESAVPEGARLVVAFGTPHSAVTYSPFRLPRHETVFATTVHKSQGCEFDDVTLILPDSGSPLLTRELIYTALTRARRSVTVAGTESAVREAVGRPGVTPSGLRRRLSSAP